jgi:subtilisin family serine protease
MEKKDYFSKSLRLAVAGFGVVAATFTITSCEKDTIENITPLGSVQDVQEQGALIPGKYIVVFEKGADFGLGELNTYEKRQARMRQESRGILRGKGIPEDRIERVYGAAIKGMAVGLTNAELQRLRNDPRVAYIEQDRVIKLAPPAGKGPKDGGGTTGETTPWGITRVGGAIAVSGATGTAWIIDTGIDLDHPDLNVDASNSMTVFTSGPDSESADDLNGHGSHVAGTVAAIDNEIGVIGVAAGATVVAVKVLDRRGSGSYSGVIDGINYVAGKGQTGDVANMSLGGSKSQALNDAVIGASANVKFSVAAGNDGADANNYSPASANGGNIYTISAIDATDKFASWSNWGNPPVDYAAPGVSITSTWKDGGYNTISGTSMAAPHVAGILLLGSVSSDGSAIGDPDKNPDPIAVH